MKERLLTYTRGVYGFGLLLATLLFAAHTWALFETSYWLHVIVEPAIQWGPHVAGPLIILACFAVLFTMHMLEAAAWALFFLKLRQFEDFGQAMYFAGTSLTALGYGDLVLRHPWRILGPIMATNGILMFGCSTAFLFLVIQRVWVHT